MRGKRLPITLPFLCVIWLLKIGTVHLLAEIDVWTSCWAVWVSKSKYEVRYPWNRAAAERSQKVWLSSATEMVLVGRIPSGFQGGSLGGRYTADRPPREAQLPRKIHHLLAVWLETNPLSWKLNYLICKIGIKCLLLLKDYCKIKEDNRWVFCKSQSCRKTLFPISAVHPLPCTDGSSQNPAALSLSPSPRTSNPSASPFTSPP